VRTYTVDDKLLTPEQIKAARLKLGLSLRGLAELLLLSPEHGQDRVFDWEEGTRQITGPASQAIRFALAIMKIEAPPERPKDRPAFGYQPILEEFLHEADSGP
jgi:DNA-binding transcriptional MerR regulator